MSFPEGIHCAGLLECVASLKTAFCSSDQNRSIANLRVFCTVWRLCILLAPLQAVFVAEVFYVLAYHVSQNVAVHVVSPKAAWLISEPQKWPFFFLWGKEENRISLFNCLTLEEHKSLVLNILFIYHAKWELKTVFYESEGNLVNFCLIWSYNYQNLEGPLVSGLPSQHCLTLFHACWQCWTSTRLQSGGK